LQRDVKVVDQYRDRSAVLSVLDQVRRHKVLAVQAMRSVSGWNRLEPRERALANEIVLGVLRHRAYLDRALSGVTHELPCKDPRLMDVLRLGAYQILRLDGVPDHAAVDSTVGLVRRIKGPRIAGFVNGALRTLADTRDEIITAAAGWPAEDRYSIPDWLLEELRAVVGENWEAELELMNSPSPITFRAVQGAVAVPAVIKELARWNITAVEDPRFPEALIIPSNQPPYETAPFLQGRIMPQDPASQAVIGLADPLLGELVVDLGAGLGTKTEQLFHRRTSEDQRVLAVDISPSRLGKLKERLPDPSVGALVADATGNLPLRKGVAGTVILDAPCSNLGTIRRHPEVKWWRRAKDLSAHAKRQGAMLRQGARLLGPGGRLVYAVCSFARAEGVDLVDGFLESHPRFRAVPVPEELALPGTPYMLTTPARHGTDLFFAAIIERI